MTIKGRIADIVFQNEENGYAIVNFDTGTAIFTAVGIFPRIAPGEILTLDGEFRQNAKYGHQFTVESVTFSQPTDEYGIIKYLGSGLFKGVGEKLATQIVAKFGVNTLEILERNPAKLCEVQGVGWAKMTALVEGYLRTKNMREAILFLQKLEISMGLAMKIYRQYEDACIMVVEKNPYALIKDVDGVGFITADRVAAKLGIDTHNAFRIESGIIHILSDEAAKFGHTCLPQTDLIEKSARILGVDEDEVAAVLKNLRADVLFHESENETLVATSLNYNAENAISARLLSINRGADGITGDIDEAISSYQDNEGIELHEGQKEAIKEVFKSGVTVITGGPGTGKTTIIKGITTICADIRKRVVLTAPTGRAAKRMTQSTGIEAKTIHRLLESEFSTGKMQFAKNEKNLLSVDVLIVDEISMVDIYIFNALLKALPTGARLVLVGDKDQLPSVSCGNILSDIIGSDLISVCRLTEVYRQAKGSEIVTNAHRINAGKMPVISGATDFFMSKMGNPDDIVKEVLTMVKTRIPSFAKVSAGDIQVLCPVKRGVAGVENLNAELQDALNPQGKEIAFKNGRFRKDDKVMQIQNNYDKGVFNGDIGVIHNISTASFEVIFDDGKKVTYNSSESDQIMLAYAVSVHKAQGCEFPVIIFVASGGGPFIMTKNLLYTAVTRAQKMVVIIGEDETIAKMVRNNYTGRRYSLLKEFLLINSKKLKSLWN